MVLYLRLVCTELVQLWRCVVTALFYVYWVTSWKSPHNLQQAVYNTWLSKVRFHYRASDTGNVKADDRYTEWKLPAAVTVQTCISRWMHRRGLQTLQFVDLFASSSKILSATIHTRGDQLLVGGLLLYDWQSVQACGGCGRGLFQGQRCHRIFLENESHPPVGFSLVFAESVKVKRVVRKWGRGCGVNFRRRSSSRKTARYSQQRALPWTPPPPVADKAGALLLLLVPTDRPPQPPPLRSAHFPRARLRLLQFPRHVPAVSWCLLRLRPRPVRLHGNSGSIDFRAFPPSLPQRSVLGLRRGQASVAPPGDNGKDQRRCVVFSHQCQWQA